MGEQLADRLQLVSHDVRAEILVALSHHHRDCGPDATLGFADLRRRVGHDDPGNFNYHLERLRGTLVEQTEEGYQLSAVGHRFVAVLVSGRFDPDRSMQFPDTEVCCLVCGDPASVSYADGHLQVSCSDSHHARLNVGPELLERRSVREALRVALRRSLLESRAVIDGVCSFCSGVTTGELVRLSASPLSVWYEGHCERCGVAVQNTAGGCVVFHPAVVSFCYQHGRNIYRRAWDTIASSVDVVAVSDEDPLRVDVAVTLGAEQLELTLDRSATVTGVERVSTAG